MRIHTKYGLNPTISVCFWCKEETGELVLLGAAFRGEAPIRMITSYEPCEKCKEAFNRGIVVIEVSDYPFTEGQPKLLTYYGNKDLYASGSHVVITEDAVRRIFPDQSEKAIKHKKMMADKKFFQEIFGENPN